MLVATPSTERHPRGRVASSEDPGRASCRAWFAPLAWRQVWVLATSARMTFRGGGTGGKRVGAVDRTGTPTRPGCAGPPLPFEHSSHGLLGSNRATGAICRLTPSPAKPLKGEGDPTAGAGAQTASMGAERMPGVRPPPRRRHPRTCSEDPGDPSRNRAARGHACNFDGPGPAHARPLAIPPAAPLGVAGLDQAEPFALKRAGQLQYPLPVGAR